MGFKSFEDMFIGKKPKGFREKKTFKIKFDFEFILQLLRLLHNK